MKRKKGILIIFLFLLVIISILIQKNNFVNVFTNIEEKKEEVVYEVEDHKEEEVVFENNNSYIGDKINISSYGNILVHLPQIYGSQVNGGYDFKPSFQYVREVTKDSHIGIGVLETTLLGNGKYSGYPLFNSPDEILSALKDSGINVVNYANNHIIDGGFNGFLRTIETTKNYNMDVSGVRLNTSEKKYLVKEVKGEKIGIISYIYDTSILGTDPSINGILLPEEARELINIFNYGDLQGLYKDVQANIESMKKEGVDFFIVGIHWGEEYNSTPNNEQIEIAKELNKLGVHIVLGNHPHVVQPYEILVNKEGHKTFVVYAQGNNLSNQCYETLQNEYTEDGFIVKFQLLITEEGLKIDKYEILPVWVYREIKENGLLCHKIIPLTNSIEVKELLGNSNPNLSLERTKGILSGKVGEFDFN